MTEKKKVQVGVIGHVSRGMGSLAAVALLNGGALNKAFTDGPDLSKDPRFVQPDKYYDKLIAAQDKDFPMPTNRKGGLKKHIQATRPRWRQPK